MYKTYLKLAFRRAIKNPLDTAINLFGLSISIACCLIIFLYVANEFKYDQFHTEVDKIYRITTSETSEGNIRNYANSYLPYLPLLESQRSEVQNAVRLFPQNVRVAKVDKSVDFQEENFYYVDPDFFDLFSFSLLEGDINTVLEDPNNLVITKKIAIKYFGDAKAIGKELIIEKNTSLKIAGILADIPSNSSLKFEMIAPMKAAEDIMGSWVADANKTWHYPPVYSFVKFRSDTDKASLEQHLNTFEDEFVPEYIRKKRSHSFQKLSEVHFSNLESEMRPSSNKNVLYIFMAIGIVILCIAAFNFINLFLARLVLHFKVVGIQKVNGARNSHMWQKNTVEVFSYIFISVFLAIVWVLLFLPVFNPLMNSEVILFSEDTLGVWVLLLALLLVIGFLTSTIPSVIVSRFKLITILKSKNLSFFQGKKTISTQSMFVVFQFSIAIVLIIATIGMQSQMGFMKDKYLGMVKENIIVIPVRDESVQKNFTLVKQKLLQLNGINNVSAISNFPWAVGYYDFETTFKNKGNEVKANAPTLLVDQSFIETMGMTMVKGRGFSKDFSTDSTAFIINETAAVEFGIKDIEDVELLMASVTSGNPKKGKLIGIVKDFHLQSLHEVVQPLILTISPHSYFIDNLIVSISGENTIEQIDLIESQLQEVIPDLLFDFFFLDEALEELYQKERKINVLYNYFSIIAIIIACLGLLGIVTFSTAQRTKEIGIRKVLGFSVMGVVTLVTKDFLKLVFVSIIIATPLGWLFLSKWLEDFAYKINIGWWIFVIAGVIALLFALLTISYQAVKVALTNPVKSLRTE